MKFRLAAMRASVRAGVQGLGFRVNNIEDNNNNNNNNNRRLVTLAEHTSDHGKQTNASTKERGSILRIIIIYNVQSVLGPV